MFDLRAIPVPENVTPAWQQATLRSQGHNARMDTAFDRTVRNRILTTRTAPDIKDAASAQGSYFSSGTKNKINRASEDTRNANARDQMKLDQFMLDIQRNMFFATLGVQL